MRKRPARRRPDRGTYGVSEPDLKERWPWLGPDLQTVRNQVVASLGRRPDPLIGFPGERLTFVMPDGSGDRLTGMLHRPLAATRVPLVVLVHGLTGCQDSRYLLSTARVLLGRGFPVLRLNLRGAGPLAGRCRGHYHAGRSEDLAAVLATLKTQGADDNGVALVGYSLGANMMLKMLGELGGEARDLNIRCAVSVSAPIDLAATARRMMALRNRLYQVWLLRRMKAEFAGTPLGGKPDDREAQARRAGQGARTVWEFDDVLVAPLNGFGDAATYYRINHARAYLDDIRVPTLIIHAQDDPWIPAEPYLTYGWRANRFLLPVLPHRGGHVGFHMAGATTPWHDRATARFLERLFGGGPGRLERDPLGVVDRLNASLSGRLQQTD